MHNPIKLDEEFPHLTKAPIVEAAIDIRMTPSVAWDEKILQDEVKKRLPDYPGIETLKHAEYLFSAQTPAEPVIKNLGCVGIKLSSANKLHVAQFNKGAFVFSRLKPYEDWPQLIAEASKCLNVYVELLHPTEVSRIGLRFINRIVVMDKAVELSDYYKYPPKPIGDLNWPLTGYLNHDVIHIPGTHYSVNLIKTIQKSPTEIGLILDVDVFVQDRFDYDEKQIKKSLAEMRWVKNKIFSESLTQKTIEGFR